MPSAPTDIVVFGDLTTNYHAGLDKLLKKRKASPSLDKFLTSACDALRKESARRGRKAKPQFADCITLNEFVNTSQECKHPALACALLYIFQAGSFLWFVDKEKQEPYIRPDTIIFALCNGMLPAAALAASTTLAKFARTAVDFVEVAFRIGEAGEWRTEQMEPSASNEDSFAFLVHSLPKDQIAEEIEKFNSQSKIPRYRLAYISAQGSSWAVVSGPPSTLAQLFQKSVPLRMSKRKALPVQCAYHARHLPPVDPMKLIPASLSSRHMPMKQPILFSSSTAKRITENYLYPFLRAIIIDIFEEQLRPDDVCESICAHVRERGLEAVNVRLFGATMPHGLVGKLELAGINVMVAPNNVEEVESKPAERSISNSDVAIVGMAGRFPNADTLDEFWEIFDKVQDLHKKVPKDRFDLATHYDPTGALRNSTSTPYGCFLDNPGSFDTKMFNMSPREAAQTDPQQRLLLMTTYEALEMAGYVPYRTCSTNPRNIGVFVAQTSDDYKESNSSQEIGTYFATGGLRAFGPGRLNHHFQWEGPSYSLDTACSSSLSALHLAYLNLMQRQCDTAVVGATNILTSSALYAGLSRESFLSPTGGCKTFDDTADGYCRADAVATVVLKRLEDAIMDRDNILGVIKASARNTSAEAESITRPHAGTQQRLFRTVLSSAGIDSEAVDYVEFHGTGTQAGDVAEMTSVMNCFAPEKRARPLYLGSVKPSVGHSEPASGLTSLIRVLMMLKKNAITPATAGIKTKLNRNFPDLASLNVHIPQEGVDFGPRSNIHDPRTIFINNFDAAAGNSALLIQEGPKLAVRDRDPRKLHIVAVSAKSAQSFEGNIRRLIRHIELNPEISIADLSYTTTARRMHYHRRKCFAVSSTSELRSGLEKALTCSEDVPPTTCAPRVAFTFTGQGASYLDMGKQLFEDCAIFRDALLDCDSVCQGILLPSFLPVIDGSLAGQPSPVQAQLAHVYLQIALTKLWRSYGLEPALVIGHSLGEYAALCAAGVLSVSDTLFLVGKRAEIMVEKCVPGTHGMLAVNLSGEHTSTAITESGAECELACYNGPTLSVVAGARSEIQRLESWLGGRNTSCIHVNVSFGFHSAQMDTILRPYHDIASRVNFQKPSIPVASIKLGKVVADSGIFGPEYIVEQTRKPVQFLQALYAANATNYVDPSTIWVEIGPNVTNLKWIRPALNAPLKLMLPSMEKEEENWYTIARSLVKAYDAGVDVAWGDYHKQYEKAHRLLDLPSYSFELKNYWIDYKGDWQITKGTASNTLMPEQKQAFATTSLQRIVKEVDSENETLVLFESDLREPHLNAVIKGHRMDGVAVCPTSVYADMAYGAAKYIYELCSKNSNDGIPVFEVKDMDVRRPLILDYTTPKQLVRVVARMPKTTNSKVDITYAILEAPGFETNATCTVVWQGHETGLAATFNRNSDLFQSRIKHLIKAADSGNAHRLLGSMVYRLFSGLMKYDSRYQAIEEAWMDTSTHEGTARVKFAPAGSGERFHQSPYWLDAFIHVAGFILNGSDRAPEDYVFISNGWRSMTIVEELSSWKTYQVHVCMHLTEKRGELEGDIYAYDGDMTVFVCNGLRFKRISKDGLRILLERNPSVIQRPPQIVVTSRGEPAHRFENNGSISPVPAPGNDLTSTFDASTLLCVIADEIQVGAHELRDEVTFGELGVDSLLSMSLLAKLRPLTTTTLPTAIFARYNTIGGLKKYLQHSQHDSQTSRIISLESTPIDIFTPSTPAPSISTGATSGQSELSPVEVEPKEEISILSTLKAHCFFLQGDPSAAVSIFMLPDGSGSASSYVPLPPLTENAAIYGISSPFVNNPGAYTIPFEETIPMYLEALRAVRPHGPYMTCGYSVGGTYAYEVAAALVNAGETVLGVLLIDAPCRLKYPPLPHTTVPYLQEIGIFDVIQVQGKLPEIVWHHLKITLDVLEKYKARPLAKAKQPKGYLIWCNEGVSEWAEKKLGADAPAWDDEGKPGNWFMNARTDFGPLGWDELLDVAEIRVVDGNHFTAMTDPYVFGIGDVLKEFLNTILE